MADVLAAPESITYQPSTSRLSQYPMISKLNKRLNGRRPIAYVTGLYSFYPNSKLSRALKRLGLKPEDEGITFELVRGGRAGINRNDGIHMAIVKL